jgi:hypothetical protein
MTLILFFGLINQLYLNYIAFPKGLKTYLDHGFELDHFVGVSKVRYLISDFFPKKRKVGGEAKMTEGA